MAPNPKRTPNLYNQSLSLLTDLYQITMSYGYWKAELHNKETVFHLFFRRNPFHGGFTVAAGLEEVIDYIRNFHFDASDLEYLATLKGYDGKALFPTEFLHYLSSLRFTGNIDAMPEGSVVFPQEPLLRIQGPVIECQLLESPLLTLTNFSTLIATKATRVCLAAQGDEVIEFGMRRAQGIDGAITAARAAYIGGCQSTSNVLAGKLYDIPVKGTHSHSWVMVFDEEIDSFKTYAEVMPNNCVFLVDTYDTVAGVKKAIEIGRELKKKNKKLLAIRLDSGDLADLSIKSRHLLDEAGFQDTKIMASNELDEAVISELKRQNAQISIWGVGTKLATGHGESALGGVYKLSAVRDQGGKWKYKLKLSDQMEKVTNPGILQVRRFYSGNQAVGDMIFDENLLTEKPYSVVDPYDVTKDHRIKDSLVSKNLLIPIYREGKQVYEPPLLKDVREFAKSELDTFPVGIKRFLNPHTYNVGMEKNLYDLKVSLVKQIRKGNI